MAALPTRFFRILFCRLDPEDLEEGMGEHRRGDMPVPTVPDPNLIVFEAHLMLGLIESRFDRPVALVASVKLRTFILGRCARRAHRPFLDQFFGVDHLTITAS